MRQKEKLHLTQITVPSRVFFPRRNLFLFQTVGKFVNILAVVQLEAVTVTEVAEGGREERGGEGWARMDWKCASSSIYKHGPFTHLRVIVYIHPYVPFLTVCFCSLRAES